MAISVTPRSNVPAFPTALPQNAPATASAENPAIAGSTDTVTLSSQAQQALASPAADAKPAAASPAVTTSPAWSSDQVTQAIAALNDTSGNTTVAAQIDAYTLMNRMVANGTNFDPSNTENADAVDIATAFQTSAFAQHAQSLADQMFAYNNQTGVSASEAGQRKLSFFNSLSSGDQQTVLATMGAAAAALGQQPAYGSVDSYKANIQAGIDVNRAVETAYAKPAYAAGMTANMPAQTVDANTARQMSLEKQATDAGDSATLALLALTKANLKGDALTDAANAYFSEYGPPPPATDAQSAEDNASAPAVKATALDASAIRAGYQALATLNDSSTTTSTADLVAAWQLAGSQLFPGGTSSLARVTMSINFTASIGNKTVQQAGMAYDQASWAGRGGSEISAVQAQITAFKGLSSQNQQIVSMTAGRQGYDATPDGYLSYLNDGLKNAAQGDAINAASKADNRTLYESLIASLFDYTKKPGWFVSSPKTEAPTGSWINRRT